MHIGRNNPEFVGLVQQVVETATGPNASGGLVIDVYWRPVISAEIGACVAHHLVVHEFLFGQFIEGLAHTLVIVMELLLGGSPAAFEKLLAIVGTDGYGCGQFAPASFSCGDRSFLIKGDVVIESGCIIDSQTDEAVEDDCRAVERVVLARCIY